ncbi:unnamed protein product [Meloidogyne enterolobii]
MFGGQGDIREQAKSKCQRDVRYGLNLLGCLERYFQTWTTTESCIRCSKKQLPARAYLWNMPSILIIHLGRSK